MKIQRDVTIYLLMWWFESSYEYPYILISPSPSDQWEFIGIPELGATRLATSSPRTRTFFSEPSPDHGSTAKDMKF